MRIPMNYIEHLPHIVFLSLIAGLYFPLGTNIVVWTMLLGRVFYSIGYMKEAKLRIPGALIDMLGTMSLIVLSIISTSYYLNDD